MSSGELEVLVGEAGGLFLLSHRRQRECALAAPYGHDWTVDSALVRTPAGTEQIGQSLGPSPLRGTNPPALLEQIVGVQRRWL